LPNTLGEAGWILILIELTPSLKPQILTNIGIYGSK